MYYSIKRQKEILVTPTSTHTHVDPDMFTCLDLYLMTHWILEYPHTAGKGVQILFKYPYMQNVMTQIRFFKDLTEATFIFHLMFFSVTWTVEEIWNRVPACRHYCWIWFSGSQPSWACDSIMTSQISSPFRHFYFFSHVTVAIVQSAPAQIFFICCILLGLDLNESERLRLFKISDRGEDRLSDWWHWL